MFNSLNERRLIMGILLKNLQLIEDDGFVKRDVYIEEGKILGIEESIDKTDSLVIDLSGKIGVPSFVDIHAHLRDPGYTHKEDIISGSNSAAAGGFTTILCMPNTNPPIDNVETIRYIQEKAEKHAPIKVLVAGAVTKGLLGEEMTDMEALAAAGVKCFTDDGQPIMNSMIMREALSKCNKLGIPIFPHCEDKILTHGGIMNEGVLSRELGLTGIPNTSEDVIVARDIVLAKETGGHLHITHLSTAGSVEMIRIAKENGMKVTCDVTPHNLFLTEEYVRSRGTNAIMYPPLRTKDDVLALRQGLKDGTVDAIATDHAPHTDEEKSGGFGKAPKGIVGFETAFAVCLESLVHNGILTIPQLIEKMSYNPAKIIGITPNSIEVGSEANMAIIDLDYRWTVDKNKFLSKSRNTPFHGLDFVGKVIMTLSQGNIVYKDHDAIKE
jgi:dihydroorotase